MLPDKLFDWVQLVFCESMIFCNLDRFQPKLCDLPVTLYVNVRGFSTIGTKEHKTIGSNT
jgi:hypothetical protein